MRLIDWFLGYLMNLLLLQVMQPYVRGWIVNDELERVWKQAVVDSSPGRSKENNLGEKNALGTRIEPGTSGNGKNRDAKQ
jgi:hypothetical protein